MKAYNITSKQISAIHNGMCSVRRLEDVTKDLFKDDSSFSRLIHDIIKNIEPVRKDLMDKVDADYDKNYNYYKSISQSENITNTIWSIYEVDNLYDESNVPKNTIIRAEGFVTHITNNRWIDLWKAVDSLARQYEDDFGSHVFIEKFVHDDKRPGEYEVWLGS